MSIFKQCPLCKAKHAGSTCPECAARSALDASAAPAPLRAGQRFRDLEIVEELGRGGMGIVYKARQPSLDRFVALKILAPEQARLPTFTERFEREAKALAALAHPNIVAIHDFGREGKLYFIVMEYVDGASLRGRKFSTDEAVGILAQVCDALGSAHKHGVVHRDIKPDNLLLDSEGRIRVADFGLAKPADGGGVVLTQSGTAMGTALYMAPEQILTPGDVDARADLYAAGVVLYEMLTGELPVGPLTPLSDPRFDSLVKKATSKDRNHRHASAVEFKTDLLRVTATEVVLPRKGNRLRWAAALTVVALVGGAAALIALLRKWPASQGARTIEAPLPDPPRTTNLEFVEIHAWNPRGGRILGLSFSGDGTVLASSDGWTTETVSPRAPWGNAKPTIRHGAVVTRMAFSPASPLLALGSPNRAVYLIHAESHDTNYSLGPHTDVPSCLSFRPDGAVLAVGYRDGIVKLWNPSTRSLLKALTHAPSQVIQAVAFHPRTGILASGSADGSVKLWGTDDGKERARIPAHVGEVLALAYDPQGRFLVSGGKDGTIRFWSDADRTQTRTLAAHPGGVRALVFRPAGDVLVSGGEDSKIRLWNIQDGELLQELPGHAGAVMCLSFHPEGTLFASGGEDRRVRLWGPANKPGP